MSAGENVFTYGSLMYEAVWTRVVRGQYASVRARLAGFRRMSEQLNATLPGPDRVATVVFRAATDPSSRLRSTAAPGAIAVLHRFLPDAVWRRLIAFELARRSK